MNKNVVIILSVLVGCFVLLLVAELDYFSQLKEIFEFIISSDGLKLQIVNAAIVLSYLGVFGYLGRREAQRQKRDVLLWTMICAIIGVWGYLYLIWGKKR